MVNEVAAVAQRKTAIDRFMVRCPYCKSTWAVEGRAPHLDAITQVEAHIESGCEKTAIRVRVRINPYHLTEIGYAPYQDATRRAQAAYDVVTADWRVTQVRGTFKADVHCDARCLNAKHGDCECSCGGKNHGAGRAA